jgi:Zn-dependent protease
MANAFGMYVGSAGGVAIYLHWSILIALLLFSFILSVQVLPDSTGDVFSTGSYWVAGVLTSVVFLASILLHELGHCIMARRNFGLHVESITLFIFGGVSSMGAELSDPKAEFFISIAGPVVTLLLGAVFTGLFFLSDAYLGNALLSSSLLFLAIVSATLLVFNLLPLFPLDGGRIFRATLVVCLGGRQHRVKATKIATGVSVVLCWAIVGYAVYVITLGDLLGGVWLIIIAMFLMSLAKAELQHCIMNQSLEGITAGDLCTRVVIQVPANLSISVFISNYILVSRHACYPCFEPDTGVLSGFVYSASVQRLTQRQRDTLEVGDICLSFNQLPVDERVSVTEVLDTLAMHDRVLVVNSANQLVGILTLKDVLRAMDLASFARENEVGGSRSRGTCHTLVYAQAEDIAGQYPPRRDPPGHVYHPKAMANGGSPPANPPQPLALEVDTTSPNERTQLLV